MNLKSRLKAQRPCVGSWITLGHSSVAEIMTHAGFDFLVVDMEHSVIELSEAQDLIRAVSAGGVVPLVRVGENNANLIKRVMDAGAQGVIVPLVNTPEDARAAVFAAKYPPFGRRGVGLARAQGYGFSFERYMKKEDPQTVVLALIEHREAIENLEEILSVQGLDGTLIGPYDLSASLGYPGQFEKPIVRKAVERYEKVCRRMDRPMGFHMVWPDLRRITDCRRRGYTFLAVGTDSILLGLKCAEILQTVSKIRKRS